MARDKWSLPEMAKVTDQRLVWLVIALCGGILLADFVPLQRVGLGEPVLLALFGVLLAGLTAWLVMGRSQGVLFSHQTQQILVVREDNGRFRQTGDLSDFWRGIIAERLGSAEWQACSPPFCRV